ncbi:GNAT family N-acetyltransferase [Brachybacterium tyrofermentans]|uniref:GNAT family N-acetyltransferase n=1 Tax=Brachybacterium tyrofermentans TaxID=47848 RepID=UPI003FD5BFC1
MPHLPALRLATAADLKFLAAHDRHLPVERLSATIRAGHVLVVDGAEGILGWLRWGLFWDEIPFMNMLFVLEPVRGRGLGGRLVQDWEARARADGHDAVLTSTRSDETAQHFYRRRGYADAGALLLPDEPAELILRKELLGVAGHDVVATEGDEGTGP